MTGTATSKETITFLIWNLIPASGNSADSCQTDVVVSGRRRHLAVIGNTRFGDICHRSNGGAAVSHLRLTARDISRWKFPSGKRPLFCAKAKGGTQSKLVERVKQLGSRDRVQLSGLNWNKRETTISPRFLIFVDVPMNAGIRCFISC